MPKPGWEETDPTLIGSCSWKLAETGPLVKDVELPKKKVGAVLRLRSIPLALGVPLVLLHKPDPCTLQPILGRFLAVQKPSRILME